MKGYIVTICIGMFATIAVAYNSLEYRGQPNNTSCSGECYAEYVAINGTPAEIEAKKKELANLDEFSSCLLYTSPSPRDKRQSRMPSSA